MYVVLQRIKMVRRPSVGANLKKGFQSSTCARLKRKRMIISVSLGFRPNQVFRIHFHPGRNWYRNWHLFISATIAHTHESSYGAFNPAWQWRELWKICWQLNQHAGIAVRTHTHEWKHAHKCARVTRMWWASCWIWWIFRVRLWYWWAEWVRKRARFPYTLFAALRWHRTVDVHLLLMTDWMATLSTAAWARKWKSIFSRTEKRHTNTCMCMCKSARLTRTHTSVRFVAVVFPQQLCRVTVCLGQAAENTYKTLTLQFSVKFVRCVFKTNNWKITTTATTKQFSTSIFTSNDSFLKWWKFDKKN